MMNWTTAPCFVSVAFILAVTAAGPAVAKDTLSVAANAPAVPLAPRSPGRYFVRLPTLEFTFEIQTDCSGSRSPESLSLNVADTRKSLTAEQIISDGPTEISLQIPASQIAPLVIEDFCVLPLEENSDTVVEAPSRITIPSALSAQASLLCAGNEDKAMTYVSRSLDVALVCEQLPDKEEPGE
jgi:hypothetical protein